MRPMLAQRGPLSKRGADGASRKTDGKVTRSDRRGERASENMWWRFSLVVGLTLAPLTSFAADPFASDWGLAQKSRARLIADGAGGAALEIELAPGAITYWRDPGDAGVPPTFDFAGSVNVAKVHVDYPAPSRILETDGSEAFGYREKAVFPLDVMRADPSDPAALLLDLSYAVCEKICLPAHARLSLSLATGVSTPYAAEIAAARARVPASVDAAALGAEVTPTGSNEWRLCFAPSTTARELFVEPPEGFWLTAAAEPGGDCFALALRQSPPGAEPPIPVTATLVEGPKAFETKVTLVGK